MRTLLFLLTLCLSAKALTAQQAPVTPNQIAEHYALLTDANRSQDYEIVLKEYQWFEQYAPAHHESVYILAIKANKALAENSSIAEQQLVYGQQLLKVYDSRLIHFEASPATLSRKCADGYQLLSKQRPRQLLLLFKTTLSALQSEVNPSLLPMMADLSRRVQLLQKQSNQQLLEDYSMLMHINEQLCQTEERAVCKARGEKILRLFPLPEMACSTLATEIGGLLAQNPDSRVMAKLYVKMSLAGDCYQSEELQLALQTLLREQEDYGLRRLLALVQEKQGDYVQAISNLERAVALTNDTDKQAMCLWRAGMLYFKEGKKAEALASARQSLTFNDTEQRAYKLLGDLYMSSFEECADQRSEILSRAVFILAYNAYVAAQEEELALQAKAQFPTRAMLHMSEAIGLSEGATVEVDCWYQAEVLLRGR